MVVMGWVLFAGLLVFVAWPFFCWLTGPLPRKSDQDWLARRVEEAHAELRAADRISPLRALGQERRPL
jgi:hypothetical protein